MRADTTGSLEGLALSHEKYPHRHLAEYLFDARKPLANNGSLPVPGKAKKLKTKERRPNCRVRCAVGESVTSPTGLTLCQRTLSCNARSSVIVAYMSPKSYKRGTSSMSSHENTDAGHPLLSKPLCGPRRSPFPDRALAEWPLRNLHAAPVIGAIEGCLGNLVAILSCRRGVSAARRRWFNRHVPACRPLRDRHARRWTLPGAGLARTFRKGNLQVEISERADCAPSARWRQQGVVHRARTCGVARHADQRLRPPAVPLWPGWCDSRAAARGGLAPFHGGLRRLSIVRGPASRVYLAQDAC
jgi:hypothetical protein